MKQFKILNLFLLSVLLTLSCKNKETKAVETPVAVEPTQKEKHFIATFTFDDVKDNKKLTDLGCLCQIHQENADGSVVFMDNRKDIGVLKFDGILQELQAIKSEEKIKDDIFKEYKNDACKVLLRATYDKTIKYDSAGLYIGEMQIIMNSGDTIYNKKVYAVCGC